MFRRPDPRHITQLSGEDRTKHRTDTMDRLDRLITRMAFELRSDPSVQLSDLGVIQFDQPSQRPHPSLISLGHVDFIQRVAAAWTPQMIDRW